VLTDETDRDTNPNSETVSNSSLYEQLVLVIDQEHYLVADKHLRNALRTLEQRIPKFTVTTRTLEIEIGEFGPEKLAAEIKLELVREERGRGDLPCPDVSQAHGGRSWRRAPLPWQSGEQRVHATRPLPPGNGRGTTASPGLREQPGRAWKHGGATIAEILV